jgi:hypothetical protein
MNIDELSRTQLILLVLLVSFVTSLGTGVLTVGLLDESPQTINQTVSRIVERTIETVAAAPVTTGQAASVITKETTVVVNEEDIITDAIAQHARRVGVIQGSSTTSPVLGEALLAPGAQAAIAAGFKDKKGLTFLLTFPNGTVHGTVVFVDDETGLAVLIPEEGEEFPKAPSYEFISSDTLKRGQTVIGLGGTGAVVSGIVSLVGAGGIETTLEVKKLPIGSPIITTSGNVAGVVRSDGSLSSGSAIAAALGRFVESTQATP